MSHFKRTITLFGVLAALAAVPATANAEDNGGPAGPSGCYVTDSDGYSIPVHDGESVFVDGKIYTCKGGTVIVTTPPSRVDGGSVNDQVATCRTRVLRRIAVTRRSRVSRRTATLACLRATTTRLARAS